MHTYTEADFAKAQFAVHPDGRIAMRSATAARFVWKTADYYYTDAEMAEGGWQIAHTATTAREALALVVDLAYEPEGDTMPNQTGHVVVVDSGEINVYSDGNSYGQPVRGTAYRRLLLDPPEPTRPEGAEALTALIARASDALGRDLDLDDMEQLADALAEAGFRAPEEGER
ncbi:hypothetical protein [Brachybacterium nesterenkovii]|uniref:hypothetical protein n=1 Tax=Brachybacterium nesterenkovii TaxID=47847 RepID=UPI00321BE783